MKSQIFLYKKSINMTRRNRQFLEAEGYIPIPVDNLQDGKVLANFPDVDNTWLLTTAMDLIMDAGGAYSSKNLKTELGQKVIEYLRDRLKTTDEK